MDFGLHRIWRPRSGMDATPRDKAVRPSLPGWTDDLDDAQRACCCSARPSFCAVLPAAPRTPLLLCGHHYRIHRDALKQAHAAIYGRHGTEVGDDVWTAI